MWVRLQGGEPAVTITQPRHIVWNAGAHRMMGNPISVELYLDAEQNRLGMRGEYVRDGLVALYNEDMLYAVDAGEELADLDFDEDWQVTPQQVTPEDMPPGEIFARRMIWIALPE